MTGSGPPGLPRPMHPIHNASEALIHMLPPDAQNIIVRGQMLDQAGVGRKESEEIGHPFADGSPAGLVPLERIAPAAQEFTGLALRQSGRLPQGGHRGCRERQSLGLGTQLLEGEIREAGIIAFQNDFVTPIAVPTRLFDLYAEIIVSNGAEARVSIRISAADGALGCGNIRLGTLLFRHDSVPFEADEIDTSVRCGAELDVKVPIAEDGPVNVHQLIWIVLGTNGAREILDPQTLDDTDDAATMG